MATVLESLPVMVRGRKPIGWERFADGQVWQLTIGVDVKCQDIHTARVSVWSWARAHGYKPAFRKLSETEFAVQFTKNT